MATRVGLLVTAVWLLATDPAVPQSCATSETYTCSVPAGSYSSPIIFNAPVQSNLDASPMQVTAVGSIAVPTSAALQAGGAFFFKASGSAGIYGQNGGNGGNGLGLTVSSAGAVSITDPGSALSTSNSLYGIYSAMNGSHGADPTSRQDTAGGGGNAGLNSQQQLVLTNSGAISLVLPNVTVSSGAALYGLTQAGRGGNAYNDGETFGSPYSVLEYHAQGGTGGQSKGVALTNSGAITVQLAGSMGFAGIQAQGLGGNAGVGDQEDDTNGQYGGHGGVVSVTNSAPVSVAWTWQNQPATTAGLFGVVAQSVGGFGTQSQEDGYNGGNGGAADSASVTLLPGGAVSVTQINAANSLGAGVAALLTGGNGGNGYTDSTGGLGGQTGQPGGVTGSITVTDANVTTSGNYLPGLLLLSQGGAGGPGGLINQPSSGLVDDDTHDSNGGAGGATGDGQVSVTASAGPVAVTTSGTNSPAIAAYLQGGAGGAGGPYNTILSTSNSGIAGNGGAAGNLSITLSGTLATPVSLSTNGAYSPGILAITAGGIGGLGGELNGGIGGGSAGGGGNGGSGGNIAVALTAASISTLGAYSSGILARSVGAPGGEGGSADGFVESSGGNGGAGGASGNITVTLDSASSITTQGIDSPGVLAQSLSGAGGSGQGAGGGIVEFGGTGGAGAQSGAVSISSNASITTFGATSRGILAQSLSGAGGGGASGFGAVFGSGGTGASSGAVGPVTITNGGLINTKGSNSHGILAQSIGGGGGAGGQGLGVFGAVGGDATTNPLTASANTVTVNLIAGGAIATSGPSAIGILGQSIGGGGGDGGGSTGGVSIGGSGGAGGAGGTLQITATGSAVGTTSDAAHGIVAQSVGGGGGNAGNAASNALFAGVAVGGSAGNGGNSAQATINLTNSTIITYGSKSAGLVAQSIGGGGGTGGQAYSGTVGAGFSATVAIGGSGGNGGLAGPASATVSGGSIKTGQDPLLVNPNGNATLANLLPVDSYGAVVQSIGGGGGLGGSAVAKAVAISIPVTPNGGQVAVSGSAAVGGAGGGGGNGSTAAFSLSQGGAIVTSGQGAAGVLVQSIGGGGGAGGDSSAMAAALGYGQTLPDNASSVSVTGTFTVGGTGGSGGYGQGAGAAIGGTLSWNGATPQFSADASGSPPTSITTFGDFADAVKVQSIGGGGGDAGSGSGTTQFFGSGSNTSLNVTVGSTGGSGGAGGPVSVWLMPGNGITTYGSGALGILAQSIGGGGGASQGGSFNLAQTVDNFRPGINVGSGVQGGGGGNGGSVGVIVQAPITTKGGDAVGLLAQSIGGGGGLGGSAGSDASADNPVIAAFAAREGVSNIKDFIAKKGVPVDATFTVAVGGAGGFGGAGGAVSLGIGAPIATSGDWASGVVAQSIGGGGGKGGSAAATGTGGLPEVTINANIAVGGMGGSGGAGGAVSINLNASPISTAGYGAAGVVAQSVGGGGGIGVDGSDAAWGLLSVGGALSGNGGNAGNGGPVNVNAGFAAISTTGQAAHGYLLQSVGGGGGIAGTGSSFDVSTIRQSLPSVSLSAGGGRGLGGSGGDVTFGSSNSYGINFSVTTSGNNAFGVLAQSVGGGGGIVTAPQGITQTAKIGGNDSSGSGGTVSVTLPATSAIGTTGTGAHGVVAQSVGGGGGIAGLPGTTPVLNVGLPSASASSGFGGGGPVTVSNGGTIAVGGAGAIGILAQSVGGGGGLLAGSDGSTIYAGSAATVLGASNGTGGAVSVTANGAVSATGANGIGIFAQSTGLGGTNGGVNITVGGSVSGGSGQGSALQIDTTGGSQANTVTVNTGGLLQASSGTAITATGSAVNVSNSGTITGSTQLAGGTITNNGTLNPGAFLGGSLTNNGTVHIGTPGSLQTTSLTGDLVQNAGGRIVVTIDSLHNAASLLKVAGNASLAGLFTPVARTLLPGSVTVLTAGSLKLTGSAESSLLFNWSPIANGNSLALSPASNFLPAGSSLTASQSSLSNHLSRAWSAADSKFATHFAYLAAITTPNQHTKTLDAFSGKATQVQSVALANSAGTMLGSAMSCPVFKDQGTLLGEDNCVWVRGSGRHSSQASEADTLGYNVTTAGYHMGGQHEVAPQWYLGGSFAISESWAKANDGSSGSGRVLDGSVVLKHTMGPWLFAGSLALADGAFHSDRAFSLPGIGILPPVSAVLKSDPGVFIAGARLRSAYEFSFNEWYVRPYGDFDVIYTDLPEFRESGRDDLALSVRGSSKTSVALSPMVEFGGRITASENTNLRLFAAMGMSFFPDNTRIIDASIVGASPADGTFRSFTKAPGILGNFDVGAQLYSAEGLEVKAEYNAKVGGSFLSHGGSLRFAYHF